MRNKLVNIKLHINNSPYLQQFAIKLFIYSLITYLLIYKFHKQCPASAELKVFI